MTFTFADRTRSTDPVLTVIFEGTSNYYGTGTGYPTGLGTTIGTSAPARAVDYLGRPDANIYNRGINSRLLSTAITQFSAGQSFRDLIGPNSVVVVRLGGNDAADNVTAETITAGLANYAALIRNTGARVILDPFGSRTSGFSSGQTQAGYNTTKATVWAWALSTGLLHYDAVRPYDELLDGDTAANNTTWFNADKIHFNDNGADLLGQYLAATVLKVIGTQYTDYERGLQAYYPLDLKTNSQFPSIRGKNIPLLQVGTVATATTGLNGQTVAVIPDGLNYLRTGAATITGEVQFSGTLSGWILLPSRPAFGMLFGWGQGPALYAATAGIGLLDWNSFAPGSPMNVPNSTWTHVAATFRMRWTNTATEKPGLVCQNYLNGVASGSPYGTSVSGFEAFSVGNRMGGGSTAVGSYGRVKVWNRVLSAKEIAADYASGL